MFRRSLQTLRELKDLCLAHVFRKEQPRRTTFAIGVEVLEDRQAPATLSVPFSTQDLLLSMAPVQARIVEALNGAQIAPTFRSAASTAFTVGVAGNFVVAVDSAPTAAITQGGTLPNGITFADNGDGTATLSGTPAAGTSGTYNLTFHAANGINPDATQDFTLTVRQVPAITSADNATFTVGTADTFTFTTTGFPAATLSPTGTLPDGVTFTDNGDGTATLSGTALAGEGGVYNLVITAANGATPDATQNFTLTVNEAPAFTSADNTTFTVGTNGDFTITTTGFPDSTLSFTGTLPDGVAFTDNGDGTATLTGTAAAGEGGVYNLTFTASNGVTPDATQDFTLTVDEL